MSKELWDKGLAVRKEVLGAEYVERQLKPAERVQDPRQGRAHQRLHPRRDTRGAASGGGVLRNARGSRGVQARAGGDEGIRAGKTVVSKEDQRLPRPPGRKTSSSRKVVLTVPSVRSKRTL